MITPSEKMGFVIELANKAMGSKALRILGGVYICFFGTWKPIG